MASRKPQRIHEQIQIQAEGYGPINRPKDCQARVSQAIGVCIV
jgi:hypothetical protein